MEINVYVDESKSEGSKIWENNQTLIAAAGIIAKDDNIDEAIKIIKANGGKEIKGSDLWKMENTSLRKEIFNKVISKTKGCFNIANEGTVFALDILYEIFYHDTKYIGSLEIFRYFLVDHLTMNHFNFLIKVYKEWQLKGTFEIEATVKYIIKAIEELKYDPIEKEKAINHLEKINFKDKKHFREITEAKINEANISNAHKNKLRKSLEENIKNNPIILEDNKHTKIIKEVIIDVSMFSPVAKIIVDKSTAAMTKSLALMNDAFPNTIIEKESKNEVGLWIADWFVVFIRKAITNLLYSKQDLEKDFYKENIKICKTILKNSFTQSIQLTFRERFLLDRKLNPGGVSYKVWLERYVDDIKRRIKA